MDSAGLEAIGGLEQLALDGEIAIMVGETEDNSVTARQGPGPADRGAAPGQMRVKCLIPCHQTRSSNTGTWGTSPA